MKLLDCTLRDGGYYTNWDFDQQLVDDYCVAMEALPIEYVEIGYRSMPKKEYLGEYFYCPEYLMKALKAKMPNKKLVIILNEKDTKIEDLPALLNACEPYVAMVRMAIDPQNVTRAIPIAKAIKAMGFEIAFNVMYMSSWVDNKAFIEELGAVNGEVDYFYMVDSYGGVLPDDVKEITQLVKSKTTANLGFHGHDNLEMGLINSITAMNEGCQIIDATITGMGRGAGNLKMELLLTYLSSKGLLNINFDELSVTVAGFEDLRRQHEWGTNLPYMVSGANSLPQKDVMDWVSKRSYSINSIIRALNNQKDKVSDNVKLSIFKGDKTYKKAIIVGGGPSAVQHSKAVIEYINQNSNDFCIIHSSSKNAGYYKNANALQYFCLVGNEGHRLKKVYEGHVGASVHKCILPPYPRKMGTFIPEAVLDRAFELEKVSFTDKFQDSHFSLAIQTAIELGVKEIELVGFDGYASGGSNREMDLFKENEYLIQKLSECTIKISSITPSSYELSQISVYQFLN